MTWSGWMAARKLLYEEHIGTHLRAGENAKASEYARSRSLLQKFQPQE